MTSAYGLLTVTELSNALAIDLTLLENESHDRIYSDGQIEAQISLAERLVLGEVKQTYTTETIPIEIRWAIETMAKIYMKNILSADGFIQGENIDEIRYFNEHIKERILSEEQEGKIVQVISIVDDSV